jgi:hypothetical protein
MAHQSRITLLAQTSNLGASAARECDSFSAALSGMAEQAMLATSAGRSYPSAMNERTDRSIVGRRA